MNSPTRPPGKKEIPGADPERSLGFVQPAETKNRLYFATRSSRWPPFTAIRLTSAFAPENGTGRWGLSGMGVRVAGERAISTHVPMGGHIEKIDTVLRSVL
ncbi:YheC/YheD family protein [Thermoactinomyces sp. Gus2-1]|uniref:YheC/YheD family protein n=1 Tax=Thermoactinomyces sp. Gus2-1 TaxID=1535750 RepID=UPI003510902D